MSRFQTLADELNIDPLARGYAGMTDEQAAVDMNTEYRDVNYPVDIAALEGEIRSSLKWANYREKQGSREADGNTFTFPDMSEFMDLFFTTTSGQGIPIDLQGDYMSGLIDRMEAEGSMGPAAAAALRAYGIQTVSRGTELGIGNVTTGDVTYSRTL